VSQRSTTEPGKGTERDFDNGGKLTGRPAEEEFPRNSLNCYEARRLDGGISCSLFAAPFCEYVFRAAYAVGIVQPGKFYLKSWHILVLINVEGIVKNLPGQEGIKKN